MPLYIALRVVSLNAATAFVVTGLICSLKVGVVLTSACLCIYVTTCRPLVWLSAAQQSISCPEQRIHNVRSLPPSAFFKCHRCLVKTHLLSICTTRASVVFAVFSCFLILPACKRHRWTRAKFFFIVCFIFLPTVCQRFSYVHGRADTASGIRGPPSAYPSITLSSRRLIRLQQEQISSTSIL